MPNRIKSGILTSENIVPVAADIVFGINTTNSVNWTEYQEVDENRIFNVNQIGENFRVGIKLISPSRSNILPSALEEFGSGASPVYTNTVDYYFTNSSGTTNNYHFRVTLYDNAELTHSVYSAYSKDSPDGFNVDGSAVPLDGVSITNGETVHILFTVPGSSNIKCDTYYYAKTEVYEEDSGFSTITDDYVFIASCTSTFVDNVDFDFTNNEAIAGNYHFRIKFYSDQERINEYKTVFSGNDRTGWFVDDTQILESGVNIAPGETVNVVYRSTVTDFEAGKIYYLTIDAHDGSTYVFSSNFYTFQVQDVASIEYCGEYMDVPIVKNFGIMIELNENEFVTLNV
jgi:hypothetical protein